MATVNIPGVELVKAGTWNSAQGEVTITSADLAAMVSEARDPDVDDAPVKLGHTDPRFDGEPALGWVKNLRLSSDGNTLIGDLTDVPASLADIMASAYPRRSVEIAWGLSGKNGKRGAVLTGLALLGVTPPAVKGLQDVYRAAASGEAAVTLTVSSDDTSNVHGIPQHSGNANDQIHLEGPMADNDKPVEPAEAEVEETPEAKTDEATDETPEADVEVKTDEPVTAAASAPQTVTLSQGQYDDLMAGAKAGAAALAALNGQRRDQIITAALNEGRLRPSDQEAWRSALDRDEDGTVALLNTLPAQSVPTVALGSAHAGLADPGEAAWDAFTANLTGKGA